MFSIAEQFRGATVLLTGSTGFIGSLVLELLLRTTDVAKVYVLLRQKGSSTAAERLVQLLQVGACMRVFREGPARWCCMKNA